MTQQSTRNARREVIYRGMFKTNDFQAEMNSKQFNTVHIHFKVLAIVLDLLHVHFEDGSRTTTVQSPLETAKI